MNNCNWTSKRKIYKKKKNNNNTQSETTWTIEDNGDV